MNDVQSHEIDNSIEWENVTTCPTCNSSALKAWRSGCRDSSALVGRRLNYQRCLSCACRILAPRPTPETVGNLYGTDYAPYNRRPEDTGLLVGSGRHRDRLQVELASRYVDGDSGRRVLDFGCGTSDFLDAARDAGWATVGADFSDVGVAGAAAAGHDVRVVDSTFWAWMSEQRFDAIRLNHVIEHLHQPTARLADLAQGLRRGGFLHVVTPDPEGPTCAVFRHNSVFFEAVHLTLIPPETLRRMATAIGATRVDVVPESLQKDMWRSWQLARRLAPNYAAAAESPDGRWQRLVLRLAARTAARVSRYDRYHAFIVT